MCLQSPNHGRRCHRRIGVRGKGGGGSGGCIFYFGGEGGAVGAVEVGVGGGLPFGRSWAVLSGL